MENRKPVPKDTKLVSPAESGPGGDVYKMEGVQVLKCFLFQISKTYRYTGVEDNLCGRAQHVDYYIHYFSNQLSASSDRGDNPDPKRLSILFKSCSLNGRSKMGTDSLGLSS